MSKSHLGISHFQWPLPVPVSTKRNTNYCITQGHSQKEMAYSNEGNSRKADYKRTIYHQDEI